MQTEKNEPKKKKSKKKESKKNAGSTLAEVMVSFSILAAAAAVFFHGYVVSGRMTGQAAALMAEKEELYEDYYREEGISREQAGGSLVFRRIDERDSGEFFTVEGLELYRSVSTEGKRGKIYDLSPKNQDRSGH